MCRHPQRHVLDDLLVYGPSFYWRCERQQVCFHQHKLRSVVRWGRTMISPHVSRGSQTQCTHVTLSPSIIRGRVEPTLRRRRLSPIPWEYVAPANSPHASLTLTVVWQTKISRTIFQPYDAELVQFRNQCNRPRVELATDTNVANN